MKKIFILALSLGLVLGLNADSDKELHKVIMCLEGKGKISPDTSSQWRIWNGYGLAEGQGVYKAIGQLALRDPENVCPCAKNLKPYWYDRVAKTACEKVTVQGLLPEETEPHHFILLTLLGAMVLAILLYVVRRRK